MATGSYGVYMFSLAPSTMYSPVKYEVFHGDPNRITDLDVILPIATVWTTSGFNKIGTMTVAAPGMYTVVLTSLGTGTGSDVDRTVMADAVRFVCE